MDDRHLLLIAAIVIASIATWLFWKSIKEALWSRESSKNDLPTSEEDNSVL